MGDGTARKFWQIHLLTAVVLMIQVGLLIQIFIEVYDSDQASRLIMDVGLYSLAIVCLTIVIVEYTVRAESRKVIQFSVGVALVVLGGLIGRTIATPIRIESNHRRAMKACVQFAESEEIIHRTDYPASGPLHYATSIAELYGPNGKFALVSTAFANAESKPGPAIPDHGYLYKVLTSQGPHATGGVRNYSPRYPEGQSQYMTLGYALVAFPSEYGTTGVKTFIINGNGTIFEKDLGPNTSKLGAAMTEFDPDPSWTVAR